MDYGIATRNKFELFCDDEDADPLEILRLTEEENSKKKNEVVKGKDAKSQKDSKSAKNKKNNKAQSSVQDQKTKVVEPKDARKDDKPLRNNRPRNDDRPNRPPRENRERDLPPRRQNQQQDGGRGFGQTSPSGGDQFRERGEGRGRGRGRGGRGGGRGRGGFDRFGKREFERHSGSDKTSGIKATEKREGGGAHNWGTVKDDVEDQMNSTAPAEGNEWAAQSEDTENVQPDSAPDANEEVAPEEDQTPSEMTLDEWKAQQKKQTSAFNVRKPGEGCDSKQWQKTYVLKKKVNEEEEEESEEEDEDDIDLRKKNYVPIEITFGDSRRGGGRGRGGRGGRGGSGMDRRGGRGGRGGSGSGPNTGRGGRREQAPNVEDELDFPSLGKPAA